MKFEVGDKVRCIESCNCLGSSFKIAMGEICTISGTDSGAQLENVPSIRLVAGILARLVKIGGVENDRA